MSSNPILEVIQSGSAAEYIFFRIDGTPSGVPMVAAYHKTGPGEQDVTQAEFVELLSGGEFFAEKVTGIGGCGSVITIRVGLKPPFGSVPRAAIGPM